MYEEIEGFVLLSDKVTFNNVCHKCAFNDYSGCKLTFKEFKGVSKDNKKIMSRLCAITLNGYWKREEDI